MEFDLDQTAIEAVFDLPGNEGVFPPRQLNYLRALGARRPSVFLAFPPKAAGTFLRQAAIELSGGDLVRIVHAQGGRDAQPYLPTFIAYYHGGVCAGPMVAHVHMQALPANLHFIDVFGIRPVVMIRSIPDMLASYRDMLDSDPAAQQQGLNLAVPPDWNALGDADKADYLIDMLGPWYASFYATWLARAAQKDSRTLVLHYDEFLADPAHVLRRILEHSGIAASAQECAATIGDVWVDRARLRFNQGRQGRGAASFSDAHHRRLARLLDHYPVLQDKHLKLLV
jgi:hypothetical protein